MRGRKMKDDPFVVEFPATDQAFQNFVSAADLIVFGIFDKVQSP